MTEEGRTSACLSALRRFFARPDVLEWGVAPARPTPNAANLRAWIDSGYHGSMEFMTRHLAERLDPAARHHWARSAVMFALPYSAPLGASPGPYRVAAYAFGGDYHARADALLDEAEAALKAVPGLESLRFYGFADTAPYFERDLASEAGLGWRGKNGCTLNRVHGSGFHLAGFLVDVELPASAPVEDFCGGCTRCLDLCPTGAFRGPGVLDATRCISYWTIEAKGPVPEEVAAKSGGWIFGCDVCQEVCPWNHKHMRPMAAARSRASGPGSAASTTATGAPAAATSPVAFGAPAAPGAGADPHPLKASFPADGAEWLTLLRKGGGFRSRYKKTPLDRAGRRSLIRNVANAARNLGDTSAREPLRLLLEGESDPELRRALERALAGLPPPAPPP